MKVRSVIHLAVKQKKDTIRRGRVRTHARAFIKVMTGSFTGENNTYDLHIFDQGWKKYLENVKNI